MLRTKMIKLALPLLIIAALFISSVSAVHAYDHRNSYAPSFESNNRSTTFSPRYAQSEYRSRSAVISEVKQRFNAKVLKISLNEKEGVYNVRVLMPNGKVRSLQVNARG